MSAGYRFKQALAEENPLQIIGTINAYSSLLAKKSGFRAIYLSGAGVANASFGLPDLGITTLSDVLEDARRITSICDLPLLVDGDTGWGSIFTLQRAVKELVRVGAAGVHFEDQIDLKRCGHRAGKILVSAERMCERIKAATDARVDENFVIMARTDAIATEGVNAGLDRAKQYVESGADIIFAEAVTELAQYQIFTRELNVPVLANITEFGKTPLFSLSELRDVGVRLVLYPLSAFRAMSAAASRVYNIIRQEGTQVNAIGEMESRIELYNCLDYFHYEELADKFSQ